MWISSERNQEENTPKKARRNIENAILNLLYARGLKMQKKDFSLATDKAFRMLENLVERHSIGFLKKSKNM